MIDSPTGTVTFLLSDIADSTTLWESHPARMDAALRTHDRILRAAVEHHNGIVVKHTGDGICAAFDRATRAAYAALESHLSLDAEPWPPETTLRVRIALHTGECFERNGDYFGSPLCVATRLVELTPPGSVWATEITATLLSNTGPDTIQAVPLGTRVLRGLSTPIEIFHIIRTHPDLIDSSPTPSPLRSRPSTPVRRRATGRDKE